MKDITNQLEERIPTIDAAYKETGRPKIDFSVYPEDLREKKEAEYDALVLVEAARKIERENESGEIDWGNYDQWKYIPWFRMSPSGFAFCDSSYRYSGANAGSGSRLFVLTEEACRYIGEHFLDTWKKVQLG